SDGASGGEAVDGVLGVLEAHAGLFAQEFDGVDHLLALDEVVEVGVELVACEPAGGCGDRCAGGLGAAGAGEEGEDGGDEEDGGGDGDDFCGHGWMVAPLPCLLDNGHYVKLSRCGGPLAAAVGRAVARGSRPRRSGASLGSAESA